MGDNPYRPLEGAAGELPDDVHRARFVGSGGTVLILGPRRHFDAAWIRVGLARALLVTLGQCAIAAPLMVALLTWLSGVLQEPAVLLALPIGLVAIALAPPVAYSGFPPIPPPPWPARPVDLTVRPRLDRAGAERLDLADDVGWLSLAGASLHFRGDRVELVVPRADVSAVEARWSLNGAGVLAPDTCMRLDVGVEGRRTVSFSLRERWRTPGSVVRARRLVHDIRRWHTDSGG